MSDVRSTESPLRRVVTLAEVMSARLTVVERCPDARHILAVLGLDGRGNPFWQGETGGGDLAELRRSPTP